MRLFIITKLTAIGLGLAATSSAFAAPINPTSIGKSAGEISPLTTIHYTGYYHRHRYYRRYYRPYYYGYRPYYYRPYYGYPYYRPYYYRRYYGPPFPFFPFFWW